MLAYMSPLQEVSTKKFEKKCEQIIDYQMCKYKAKYETLGNYVSSVSSAW